LCKNVVKVDCNFHPLLAGLCKERKPKRPSPQTTETGNSRLISRITNNYIFDAGSLAYHLDKYRPNVVSRKVVNYLIILLHIINFLNHGFVFF
jgi:hypothetical protein